MRFGDVRRITGIIGASKIRFLRNLCLLATVGLSLFALDHGDPTRAQEQPEFPSSSFATFTVINTNDSGAGSLRQAIIDANNAVGLDTINFNIPGAGLHTITPLSSLPFVTSSVTIDATTQLGFAGSPIIELDGTSAGSNTSGLIITAGNSRIKGLIINRFSGIGIELFNCSNSTIEGNYIGTNAAGTVALPNVNYGIIIGYNNSNNNVIGGLTAASRNVISGNHQAGIGISGSSNNQILGNYIGTNPAGSAAIPNDYGIFIANTALNNVVGGTASGSRNIISGNLFDGILILQQLDSTGNQIVGNYIGTDVSGGSAIPNVRGISSTASNNLIGGSGANAGNVIAFNSGLGIRVYSTSDTGVSDSILGNSIFSNGGLGIDLADNGVTLNDIGDGDSGSNNLQNFPVLTAATSIGGGSASIQGTLNSVANTSFRIEFFSNPSCDASGNGEGKTYLGTTNVTTNANGDAAINATVTAPSVGYSVTSTATRLLAGNPTDTSEFSACRPYSAGSLQFSAPAYFTLESGNVFFGVNVTRTGGNAGSVSTGVYSCEPFSGSPYATPGQDYSLLSGGVGFGDGDANPQFVPIQLIDDAIFESSETIQLCLANPSGGAVIGSPSVTQVILNENDPPPTLTINNITANEGNSGTTAFLFTVTKTGATSVNAAVNAATQNGTATTAGGDYQSTSGNLTFLPVETTKTFSVLVNGDTIFEPDETFLVNLTAPTNAAISNGVGTGTITNDDPQTPSVSVAVAPASVIEGSGASLTYTFTRSSAAAGAQTINFNVGGTAQYPTDYNVNSPSQPATFSAANGTVTFAAASLTAIVNVTPINAQMVEPDETIILTVTPGAGYTVTAPTSATGTIINDDTDITCIGPAPASVNENSGLAMAYTCTRNGVTATAASIPFTLGGTATFSIDYTVTGNISGVNAAGGALNFGAGFTTATVNINPVADPVVEADETVIVAFATGPGFSIVPNPTVLTGTIVNDDQDVSVAVSLTNPVSPGNSVNEDGTVNLLYTFTRVTSLGLQAQPLTVNFTTTGTATNPPDFTQTATGTITFLAGQATRTMVVDPTPDSTVEPDETVFITVTPGSGYNAQPPGAVGTITNDDAPIGGCPTGSIEYGQSILSVIDPSSCLIDGDLTELYTFNGTAGQQIVITMSSDSFFTRLQLFDPSNNMVDQTPPNGSVTDSRLPGSGLLTLPAAGAYIIRARAQSGGIGAYRLSLYLRPATGCTYSFTPRTNAVAAGGAFAFFVVTQPGCPPADTPANSGQIYNSLTYRGGLVKFNVLPNGANTRTGTIPINSQTHLINQFGTAVPSNDNFANALAITGISSKTATFPTLEQAEVPDAPIIGYNLSATAEAGEPAHAAINAAKSVWYSWTTPAASSGLYSFTTSGSDFDTVMAVYSCPASGVCSFANITAVGANDDTTFYDNTSKVNFRAVAGTRYMIAVDGKNGASGSIQLSWRSYERLFRLYLQNYNGFPSAFVPDSISASNGSNTVIPSLVSRSVYEFSLPVDNSVYVVNITGPAGIVWDPNNFPLTTAFREAGDSTLATQIGNQNVVSNAQSQTPQHVSGFIRNISLGEIPTLSVFIGSSRGPNPVDARPCTPLGQQTIQPFQYAVYDCLSQPDTLHEIVPSMANKIFVLPSRIFEHPIEAKETGGPVPPQALVATNSATYNLAGRVLSGGAGTTVDLQFTPTGTTQEISLRTTTNELGAFSFTNLAPNTYKLKATKPGYTFVSPSPISLQSNLTGVEISSQAPCTFTPASLSAISASGGSNQINVTTSHPGCEWTATSDVPWIIINSGEIVGNQPVFFTVAANAGAAREGTIRIRNRPDPVVILQAAGTIPLSFEGDLVDAVGTAAGGDGVLANDVLTIRRFVLGLATAVTTPNQFQRADCAPRDVSSNTYGDGAINSTDVTVVRRYNLGIDPPTAAAGPAVPAGTFAERLNGGPRFDPFYLGPIVRITDSEGIAGKKVKVWIKLDSQGDVASGSFTLNFNPKAFSLVSVGLRADMPAETNLMLNTNDSRLGRLGVLLDSTRTYESGNRPIMVFTFDVSPDAMPGIYPLVINGSLAPLSLSDAYGNLIMATYPSGQVLVRPSEGKY
ncbi:MAG TPA: Calx-beta domain-containing protein [Pyrinomonadaceae bacterium]|nr:right-handed parallel beta-helix repeat-containing protein [Acidobacteriota bacterium]HQZ95643.1 Calx-beta domain-containing protein [Pyrinomonadaceae bacterium]